jgi:galactitol-specific phosphotransferase system IIB component
MEKQIESISFKEMLENLFDTSWMSKNELITICAAAEMYADAKVRHFHKYKSGYENIDIQLLSKSIDDTFNQVHYSTLHPDKFEAIEQSAWKRKWIAENITPHTAARDIV